MRKLTLGILTVAGLAVAAPAVAQDVYIGGRGVGVEIDNGHRYRDRELRIRTEGYDRSYGERCRTTIIRSSDGSVKKIKRCRD
jgi:hypothetical protein